LTLKNLSCDCPDLPRNYESEGAHDELRCTD